MVQNTEHPALNAVNETMTPDGGGNGPVAGVDDPQQEQQEEREQQELPQDGRQQGQTSNPGKH